MSGQRNCRISDGIQRLARRVSSNCRVSNMKTLRFQAFLLPHRDIHFSRFMKKETWKARVSSLCALSPAPFAWNSRGTNVHAKSLCFPASARKHCSIDLSFSFARGARHQPHAAAQQPSGRGEHRRFAALVSALAADVALEGFLHELGFATVVVFELDEEGLDVAGDGVHAGLIGGRGLV